MTATDEHNISGWYEIQLSDVARIRRGASPRPIDNPRWFAQTGPGWVRISDVTRARGQLRTTEQYLSQDGVDRSVRVGHGDVIMSICATIGEPVIVEMDACIHDGFVVFDKFEHSLDGRFLFHLLRKMAPEFKASGQTGTQANLNTGIVSGKVVTIPRDIIEQSHIATLLDTVDEAIAKTEALIAKLKQVRAGLVHDLLTRGLNEHGQLRDPIVSPQQFRDSSLGRIPCEWQVCTMESVSRSIGDGAHTSVKTASEGHPFLYVSCVRDGEILWEKSGCVSGDILADLNRGKEIGVETILYTVVGSFGHAAVVREPHLFSFQRHIAYINPKPSLVEGAFLSLWLNSEPARRIASCLALGNAQKTITLGMLSSFPVPRPDITEQRRMLDSIAPVDQELRVLTREHGKLSVLKSGLMADLLTGRVRVPESVSVVENQP